MQKKFGSAPGAVILGICLTASLLVSCVESRVGEEHSRINLREASGLCVVDNQLLIVSDDVDGRYYTYQFSDEEIPIILIDPERLREVSLTGAELAMDLESIDLLADGRVAVLSEQLRCLVSSNRGGGSRYGVVAEYDKSVSELGNRGLEGLAVKPADVNASLVAVLWEGGYPSYSYLPRALSEEIGQRALEPVVIVHKIEHDSAAGWVGSPLYKFELDTPKDTAIMPMAQRYRAPDLVWHSWPTDTGSVDGFIVLLESENAPLPGSELRPRYKSKILLRYDLSGNPYGSPVEINPLVQAVTKSIQPAQLDIYSQEMKTHLRQVLADLDQGGWENVNWEGLGWFKPGVSLILIYDTFPMEPPIAFVVPLPDDWK